MGGTRVLPLLVLLVTYGRVPARVRGRLDLWHRPKKAVQPPDR
ncbi:hypothetical protein [Actinoallomurus purpureus]|nr:hypothetical protein [Actinoallomurus purpureus]